MADLSTPLSGPEPQYGLEEKEEKLVDNTEEKPSDNLLLQKLLEQNRMLEEDTRFLSHNLRLGSTSDSTSLHSTDSLSSLRNMYPPSHDQRPPLSPTPHSPLLASPTEVRHKPPHLVPFDYQDTESEEEGLGPSASILLDDGLDTRINYCDVVDTEVGGTELEVGVADSETDGIDSEVGMVCQKVEPTTTTVLSSGGDKKLNSLVKPSVTSVSDVTLVLLDDGGTKEQQVSTVPVKRARSETESIVSERKTSLASLVGRKRTLTIIESGGTLKEEPELETPQESKSPTKTAEEELWLKWSELLRNFEEVRKKKLLLTKVKDLARQGIPDPLRGMAWQLLSGSQDNELKEQYPALITEESPFVRAIQRDLNRTFPEHSFFKESNGLGQEGLLNILKAYSIHDREVGYCQGSPFITGLLLMKMPEEEAFCVFVKLMRDYRLRDLFKPSMADLGLYFYILEKFLEELLPDLYVHFKAVGFQTSMYASPWFLTMFASVLSLNVVFRIMDIFLLEGKEIIFRVGLGLMEYSKDRLLRGDLEDILKYFQKGMKSEHEANPDALIQRALKMRFSHKKMKKLEKEYLARKEKEVHEGKEISRLQTENMNMAQRISALEKECASLADRLIIGQVTLAEDAEEKFILKKKLSVAEKKLLTLECADKGSTADSAGCEGVEGVREECGDVKAEEGSLQPDEHLILVKTPIHVCKEEAEQVLRQLGVCTPGNSPGLSLLPVDNDGRESPSTGDFPSGMSPQEAELILAMNTKPKKLKIKKRLSSKFSHDSKHKYKKNSTESENNDASTPAETPEGGRDSPATHRKTPRRKKSKSLSGDLTYELARVKIQCAETAHELEGKSLELKKALQREKFMVNELAAAQKIIMSLEQKLSDVKACPHCAKNLTSNDSMNFDLTDFSQNLKTSPTNNGDSSTLATQVPLSVTPPSNNDGSETG